MIPSSPDPGRLPEGVVGIEKFHRAVVEHLPEDGEANQVLVAIETDRGPWIQALLAAGYTVYAIVACHEHGAGLAGLLPPALDHLGCQLRDGASYR